MRKIQRIKRELFSKKRASQPAKTSARDKQLDASARNINIVEMDQAEAESGEAADSQNRDILTVHDSAQGKTAEVTRTGLLRLGSERAAGMQSRVGTFQNQQATAKDLASYQDEYQRVVKQHMSSAEWRVQSHRCSQQLTSMLGGDGHRRSIGQSIGTSA